MSTRLLAAVMVSSLACATLGPAAPGEGADDAPGPSAARCSVRHEGEWVCAGSPGRTACWLPEEFDRIRWAVGAWCELPAAAQPSQDPLPAVPPESVATFW